MRQNLIMPITFHSKLNLQSSRIDFKSKILHIPLEKLQFEALELRKRQEPQRRFSCGKSKKRLLPAALRNHRRRLICSESCQIEQDKCGFETIISDSSAWVHRVWFQFSVTQQYESPQFYNRTCTKCGFNWCELIKIVCKSFTFVKNAFRRFIIMRYVPLSYIIKKKKLLKTKKLIKSLGKNGVNFVKIIKGHCQNLSDLSAVVRWLISYWSNRASGVLQNMF